MKNLLPLLFLPLSLFSKSIADKAIDDFVSGLQTESRSAFNHTTPKAFYDSSLGYSASLGGGMIKTSVKSLRPLNFEMPSLDIGCGGIDYSFGSLNVVGAEEWGKVLVDIGKAMVTHFAVLALQASTPQVLDTIYKIQSWQMTLNGFDVNSCEIGQSLAESIFPAGTEASNRICQNIGARKGKFKSRIAARHGCATRNNAGVKILESSSMKDFHGDYNLAYEALQGLGVDEAEYDIYLNISGTVIHRQNCVDRIDKKGKVIGQDCDPKYEFYKPKIEEALNLFLYGTPLPTSQEKEETDSSEDKPEKGGFYKFVRKGGIINDSLTIKESNSLTSPFSGGRVKKIEALLISILEKIVEEAFAPQSLTKDEEKFLRESSFPIEALLNLMGQSQGKTVQHHFSLHDFSEMLAIEEVGSYIGVFGNRMLQAFQKLKFQLGLAKEIEELIKGMERSLAIIKKKENEIHDRLATKYSLIQTLLKMEQDRRKKYGGEP